MVSKTKEMNPKSIECEGSVKEAQEIVALFEWVQLPPLTPKSIVEEE